MDKPDHEIGQVESVTLAALGAAMSPYVAFLGDTVRSPTVKKSIAKVVRCLHGHVEEIGKEPPTVFDREEFKQAVYHLAFDVHHFRLYFRLLEERRPTPGGHACYQAMLYSVLLHFRVLIDFFYRTPKHDDCCAVSFGVLPDFAAAFPKPEMSKELRQVCQDLNKRLVHFTATRWRVRQPSMDYYETHFDGISQLIDTFRSALPADIKQTLDVRLRQWEHQTK
jgi:hypothetical protein